MQHFFSFLIILYPVYEDIKNQKIDIRPCLMLLMAGLFIRLISGNTLLSEYLWGILPGCAEFFSGKLFGHWIGEGDCLLILSIGILEGIAFCMKLLFLSCIGIFAFSVYMLASGKLHRKSRVAGVPFMFLGYIGAWVL